MLQAMIPLRASWATVLSFGVSLMTVLFTPTIAFAASNLNVSSPNGFVILTTSPYTVIAGQPTASGALSNSSGTKKFSYPEGTCVPVALNVKNTKNSTSTNELFSVTYDYFDSLHTVYGATDLELITSSTTTDPHTAITNLNALTFTGSPLSSATTFNTDVPGTTTVTVSGPYGGDDSSTTTVSATDATRHYNMTFTSLRAHETAYVLLCARLDVDSVDFQGGANHNMNRIRINNIQSPGAVDITPTEILKLPSLTLQHTIPAGPATSTDWTFLVSPAINGVSSFSLANGSTTLQIPNSSSGTYDITLSGPSGYTDATTGTNCTFSGSTGHASTSWGTLASPTNPTNATCSWVSTAEPAQLTVIAAVTNTHGGTLTADAISLTVGATAVSSSVANTFAFGSHTVSANSVTGYSKTVTGDCDASGNITLNPGDNATCTVTFTDEQGHLIVQKAVVNDNGGTKTASDFTMIVSGFNVSTSTFPGSTSGTVVSLDAGAYDVMEIPMSGYMMSTTTGCSGTITLGTTSTCVITNNDQPGTLTVIKNVINDNNGTKVAGDFQISVSGSSPSPSTFAGSTSGTIVTLNSGFYSVSETPDSGYVTTYSSNCVDVTIGNGENKTCTITNDDRPATLTVYKHVINDDGTGSATSGAFTLTMTGSNPLPASFQGSETGTVVWMNAGAYSVSEGTVPGYTASLSADCAGSLANGENKTCTVTNNDNPAVPPDQTGTLIVITHVTSTHGGALGSSNFVMSVAATAPSAPSFSGVDAPGMSVTIGAGAYSVTGSDASGYTKSLSTDCTGSIAVSETKTCMVGYEDQPGTLTVIKNVVNDNGGTKTASDFTMTVTGTNASTSTFPGSTSGTMVMLDTGAFTVTEATVSGYALTTSGTCAGSIGIGESKICTLTNNDQAATLTVIKNVVNDDGGIKNPWDFTLHIDNNSTTTTFMGASTGTIFTVMPGTFTVTEDADASYASSATGTCSGSISLGESQTCTFTNDDIYTTSTATTATIILVKHVVNDNGGTKTASDFTLTLSFGAASTTSITGSEAGIAITIDAGTYSVTEADTTGYTKTLSADCSGPLLGGQTRTCTVTNDDVAQTSSSGGSSSGGSSGGTLPPITTTESGTVAPTSTTSGTTSSGTTSTTPPAPRVLGEQITIPSNPACVLTDDEVNQILSLIDFKIRGTPRTRRHGSGERGGVVASYAGAIGHEPMDSCDWQDVLRIANGIAPLQLNHPREHQMELTFKKIYRRAANRSQENDDHIIQIMTYGLRPTHRSLAREQLTIRSFLRIFRHLPRTTTDWDTMRAMAYGGLQLP